MNRFHYLFTGRTRGHHYALTIKPAGSDSYECELTTAYPTDNTISGQWLRRYPGDWSGQRIRRNILRYVEV